MPDMMVAAARFTGDARTAEAVERDAAGLHVVAGVERGHAAQVAALLRDLRWLRAPDDVVDLGGVDCCARRAP
jgi:hypothetical protein